MKELLYQKCLRCPWLWGCGLWWCSQWWCWLWGCSTETPADPLDSPREITHNNSGIVYFLDPLFTIFSLLFFLCFSVSSSGCWCSLRLPVSLSIFPSISSPTSTLPHLPWEHHGSQEWHHPLHSVPSSLSPPPSPPSSSSFLYLLSPPPSLFLLTHAAIAAWFQLLPESLHVGQIQFVEGDGHLSYGVISAEAVVVENLQVQSPLDHLLIGEPWERNTAW